MEPNRRRSRALLLISALARHLNHRVRTPLAVLSNDLYFFSDIIPKEDAERAKRKCAEIADILKAPLMIGVHSQHERHSVDLRAVIAERCPSVPVQGEGVPIEMDSELCSVLIWAIQDAFEVLAPLEGIDLKVDGPVVIVTVKANTPWNVPPEKQHNQPFDSLTQCVSQYLQRDSLGAIFVDAIVEELGAVLELQLFPSTTLRIALPRGDQPVNHVSNA